MATQAVPFLTTAEFAERYGLPESSVRDRCRRGEIKTVRWGRKYMIPLAAAAEFMGEQAPQHEETDEERRLRVENARLRSELRRIQGDIDRLLADG